MDMIDVILIPYLLMNVLKDNIHILDHNIPLKVRTCKIEDRTTKIIHADRFCGSDITRYADLGFEQITANNDEKALIL